MLNICCLCPTYGRPTLVQNTIAQFLAQHYDQDKCRLLILDDADQITGGDIRWKVVSIKDRYPSYCAKYGAMEYMLRDPQSLHELFGDWHPDAVALFEDDDIYGPYYLLGHSAALHNHQWSYPLEVMSLYSVDTAKGQLPIHENSGGRFWSSCAIRLPFLKAVGGFITSGRADADQLNLQNWKAHAQPGDPNDHSNIQWIYGWGRAQHCSGVMTQGGADTTWYQRHKMTETHRIDNIQPKMDDQTKWLYRQLWCGGCTAECPASTLQSVPVLIS